MATMTSDQRRRTIEAIDETNRYRERIMQREANCPPHLRKPIEHEVAFCERHIRKLVEMLETNTAPDTFVRS